MSLTFKTMKRYSVSTTLCLKHLGVCPDMNRKIQHMAHDAWINVQIPIWRKEHRIMMNEVLDKLLKVLCYVCVYTDTCLYESGQRKVLWPPPSTMCVGTKTLLAVYSCFQKIALD